MDIWKLKNSPKQLQKTYKQYENVINKVYMDLRALNPFVGVFNNPYFISLLFLFTMTVYPPMIMSYYIKSSSM